MPVDEKDIAIKIFDRLGQIDGKLSGLEQIRERADEAYDKSNKAFDMCQHNEKKVKELKLTLKWAAGFAAGILVPFIIFVLGFIFI
ncbi:hypothetical protein GCM10022378_11890 [Salinicoccus jeotgali]|uniref:Holin n=1 Tax=Salinicoccus jeotgali TaxID=381634 RepID=A0ABP7ETF8_9STAP